MIRRCIILLVSFLALASPASAQDHVDAGTIIISDAHDFFSDAGRFFTAPLHFDETDWIKTGAIVAGTVATFTLDNTSRSLAQRNHSSLNDGIFNFGREYGTEIYPLTLAGGLYAGGLAFKNNDVRETGVMLLESMGFAAAVTTILKGIAGRSRPYTGESHMMFRPFHFSTDHASLPSGHATVAFSVSSVLAAKLDHPVATVVLYGAACITAFSRVYHDAHWFSDTFLGAAIGTAAGLAVVGYHEERSGAVRVCLIPGGVCVVYPL